MGLFVLPALVPALAIVFFFAGGSKDAAVGEPR
jgi:hypothetical protein